MCEDVNNKKYSVEQTQKIIERFGYQSFGIKGFSFTFLGLIINLINTTDNNYVLFISIICICIFWFLDSFYLRMERIYRKIEENGIKKGLNYKMYPEIFNDISKCDVFFSKTIFLIYIIEILLIITVFLSK